MSQITKYKLLAIVRNLKTQNIDFDEIINNLYICFSNYIWSEMYCPTMVKM